MATTKKSAAYRASDIHNLQYPECVREKPTLYVGPLGADALLHFVREVADNVLDEMLQGRAKNGIIQVDRDGTVTVFDDGPGVPFGTTSIVNPLNGESQKLPTIRAAFGVLNTSGKYKGDAYQGAGGVHGQGAKAVNALSDSFEVWTSHSDNDKHWEYIAFERGVQKRHVIGKVPSAPTNPVSKAAPRRGTIVRWTPDLSIVGKGSKLSASNLMHWLSIKAYFVPQGTFYLVAPNGSIKKYAQPEGAVAYVRDRFTELKIDEAPDKVFLYVSPLVEVAATWGSYSECALSAFTNAIYNPERGVHFNAFFNALLTALQPFRKKRDTFTAVDLREGCIGMVNARLSGPKFDSQTKEKLVDDRADNPLRIELTKAFTDFLTKNKAFAARLCERAQNIRSLRARFSADKALAAALSKKKRSGLPTKASTAPNCSPDERELLVVEGDGAAGGCRSARDARFQEVLPLRGKPLNALRAKPEQLLASEEIMNVLTMIGYDPKKPDPMSSRRVGKLVLLSDPDPDGPLHGDTLVPIRVGGEWRIVKISELVNYPHPYKVLAFDKATGFLIPKPASCARVVESSTTSIKLTVNGSSVVCTPSHKWCVQETSGTRYRGEIDPVSGLRMIRAGDMKAGDRILGSDTAVTSHGAALLLIGTPVRGGNHIVSKVRVQQHEPTDFYCLTVPGSGTFLTASGLLSSNCHINALVLAAVWKCAPSLIEDGRVFVVDSPEYYALHKGVPYSGASAENVRLQVEAAGGKADVHHIKGWGEIDSELLSLLALNPATRKLRKIVLTDAGAQAFTKIMSDDAETRRTLLGI